MDKVQYAKGMQKWDDLMESSKKHLVDKMFDWFGIVFMGCGIVLMGVGTIAIVFVSVRAVL